MLDAVIIGAGPAGGLAALLLSRAGWSVTVVEQHAFPRDKVCGECLSALGIEVLTRAGVADLPVDPIQLTHTLIHSMEGSSCDIALPRPMWGVSRHVLDRHLLEAARAAGARVRQPARCEGLSPCVTVRDLATNRIDAIQTRYVLRADGKAPSDQTTGDFGIKAHFVDVNGPIDAIELFAVNGSYGGLAPIEGARWNAAFSVPVKRLREHRGNVDALFDEITRENRALSVRLRAARRTGPWLASPLPRFGVRRDWPDKIIPIGNAAAAIEPIGGEGMGLALRSAELAVAELLDADRKAAPINLNGLRSEYRRLWRTRSRVCRALAVAVGCKGLSTFVTPAVDGCSVLASLPMAMMGK